MTVNTGATAAIIAPSGATFKIADTKLYVPVVTLSKENDTKLLEQLKLGFKRTIKWNKYRSQITIQPQNNNLTYLIDPTFTNVNTLFVVSFYRIARENNTTKEEAYKKIMDMSNNNDYTTGNLLDFAYFKKITD